ncbi:MAG: glycosyltransferase family 39 protein [Phycisphaeraceae bacterium]|nr:glycosyltransferase family 39 protein [Phycisphaeraceae bacterium]
MLIAAAVLAARVLYLALACPYDLVEDEAQYWLWSRHIDWSYYSKGPGVAWAIGLSTALFGDAEWAVRLPSVLSGFVAMVCAAGLTRDAALFGGAEPRAAGRAAMWGMIVVAVAPVFQMTSILMTIDGPLVACWLCAAWAAWRALMHGSRIAWGVLGAALAIGFLFKYTMILAAPGVIVFALLWRARLNLHRSWRMWVAAGATVALLGLLPVVIWNAQNDWATFRHLLGHLGMSGGDMPVAAGPRRWSPWWPFQLAFSQTGMAGPGLMLGLLACVLARRALGPGASFLAWFAAPIFVFYLVVSLFAEPEGNWPIAGTTTLLALGGWWASTAPLQRPRIGHARLARIVWTVAIIYGLCASPVLLRADAAASIVSRLKEWSPVASAAEKFGARPGPIRTGRLIGARQLGAHAGRVLAELDAARSDGAHAFVIADHYGRASQLSYYIPGRPTVYCASSLMGGRRSQFDVWPHTDLHDPALRERDALLLSNDRPWTLDSWRTMFRSVEPATDSGKLEGEHKRDRVAYIGRGFLGPQDKAGAEGRR